MKSYYFSYVSLPLPHIPFLMYVMKDKILTCPETKTSCLIQHLPCLPLSCHHQLAFLDICWTSKSTYLNSFTTVCDTLLLSRFLRAIGKNSCSTRKYRFTPTAVSQLLAVWYTNILWPVFWWKHLSCFSVWGWAHCNPHHYWFFFFFFLSSVFGFLHVLNKMQ